MANAISVEVVVIAILKGENIGINWTLKRPHNTVRRTQNLNHFRANSMLLKNS